MRETPNGKRLAIEADEGPDDLAIVRLIFAEGGNPNPSAELLGSLSPGAIQRKRDRLNADALAELEAKRAASPEGQIAAAKAEEAARQERAELVELARRKLGWTPADVEGHGDTGTLRAAKFEPTPFDDLSLEDQATWLDQPENAQEAERMEHEADVNLLMSRYGADSAVDLAQQAALIGVTMESVEAELERRGVEHVKASELPAAQAAYEQAKGGESA